MLRNRSLAFKLILFFSVTSILIFSIVLAYTYHYSREIIQTNQEKDARNLALLKASRIETVLTSVQKVTQGLADHLEDSSCSKGEILALIRTTVEHNPEIYGSSVAFEPYGLDKKTPFLAPYFHRKRGKIELPTWPMDPTPTFNETGIKFPKNSRPPNGASLILMRAAAIFS